MPVSQFPGNRNWGYDGVFPYAVQNTYGGPDGLKRLINACHQKKISVILDVVYNHLGPEGNYFSQFGPYFTKKYCTPWGEAINFDGEWSDGVRDYFSGNALYWLDKFHLDGLRIDAIHAIFDSGAVNFWELLRSRVDELKQKLGKHFHLIAESDLNSPKVVKDVSEGGTGFDAQWLDDFHHALYVMLDKKGRERYVDFGKMVQLSKAYTEGFVHSGEYVKFRKRKHGASSAGVPGDKFVAFNLNHDQAGNRVGGERLCMLVDFERVKLAAAALMLAPYVPMLFMGEEYADESPFFYFVSHSDENLIEMVRKGRSEEFRDYGFDITPPDPQSEETFNRSKINWSSRSKPKHQIILNWHKTLISMRKDFKVLQDFDRKNMDVELAGEDGFVLQRNSGGERLTAIFNLSDKEMKYKYAGKGRKVLDSGDAQWMQDGKAVSGLPFAITDDTDLVLPPLNVTIYTNSVK
jgi:maltooligosyltrehalose trehalohydrolase